MPCWPGSGLTFTTKAGGSARLCWRMCSAARAFYLHLIPEFEPSPTDLLHLVLLMKDILRTLG